jgi:hypothetical protein
MAPRSELLPKSLFGNSRPGGTTDELVAVATVLPSALRISAPATANVSAVKTRARAQLAPVGRDRADEIHRRIRVA